MSTWHDLVTAGLIGTERAVVPAVGLPGLPPAEDEAGDPAAVLLDRAAMATAARRAGRRADRAEPLPVCEPDPRPAVGPAASRRLARLLSGEHLDLLTEWLTAVAVRGLRIPPQSLPALLDAARRGWPADSGLPRLLAEAGGPRAMWLAGLNPDWEFVATPTGDGDEAWRLGDVRQRRDYLASVLATDPDAARDLVTGGWPAAGPGDRVMFLSVLAGRSLRRMSPCWRPRSTTGPRTCGAGPPTCWPGCRARLSGSGWPNGPGAASGSSTAIAARAWPSRRRPGAMP